MNYFDIFHSNTYAAGGNQLYFSMEADEIRIGRVIYQLAEGGNYSYSFLFSNLIDSTYADGTLSYKNLVCDRWTIHRARVGKCRKLPSDGELSRWNMEDGNPDSDIIVSDFTELSFQGKSTKEVMPGEFFHSDPVTLAFQKGDFLCLEITFSGKMIPYHEESLLPVFLKTGVGWTYSREMPLPGMIGCDRAVAKSVAYLGDSITQGIGTKENSYRHWNALLSQKLGNQYSYWNLGIGYGRACDAASQGAWLYKAKQCDTIFVCYGVNDILQGEPEEQIKGDLLDLAKTLKQAGKQVVMQTIPPFDYVGEDIAKWQRINQYILTVIGEQVDLVFDNSSILGKEDDIHIARYGGHPNEEGCRLLAEALYQKIRERGLL